MESDNTAYQIKRIADSAEQGAKTFDAVLKAVAQANAALEEFAARTRDILERGVEDTRPPLTFLDAATGALKIRGFVGLTDAALRPQPGRSGYCTCEFGPAIGTHCGGCNILDCMPRMR